MKRAWDRVGMLTTSWPSRSIPYAGHFIRSMAEALVQEGASVAVATVDYETDGGLLAAPAIELVAHSVAGTAGGLASTPTRWLSVLRGLRRSARRVGHCDVWVAHWWPSLLALAREERAIAVLHGSDVDILEQLPLPVAERITGWIAARSQVVGVADHLTRRFTALCPGQKIEAKVCPLGAEPPRHGSLPDDAQHWAESPFRVLTVARDAPGKGLGNARRAARSLPQVAWYIADGKPPLSPSQVWALVAHADLVVVPSEEGPGFPNEGMPYVIAQAFACGRPVVGGPNQAVIEALEGAGQPCIRSPGWKALAAAVEACLDDPELHEVARRSASAGGRRRWSMVLDRWYEQAQAARTR